MLTTPFRRVAAVVIALTAAQSCGSNSEPTGPLGTTDLAGTWAEQIGVPGASYVISLTVSDTSVTGTGTFSIEAGANGTMTVSGVVHDSTSQLLIVTSIGQRQHFNGMLMDRDTMSGSFWTESQFASDPLYVTFKRVAR
jgi:hypothetical protein